MGRTIAFIVALVATGIGMIVAGAVVSASAALFALAVGMTVMLVIVAARKSAFQLVYRFQRFVLAVYSLAASAVAMTYAGAFGNGTVVLLALAAGLSLAFLALVSMLLPGKRRDPMQRVSKRRDPVYRITTL
jgi:hypothetical protein